MNPEQEIRFALGLDVNKPFVNAVIDAFDDIEKVLRHERESHKAELKVLRTENQNYREAYHDQWYNQRAMEQCWSVIGQYNRKHLELHEAMREYIRNREWNYEDNFHCKPDEPAIIETVGSLADKLVAKLKIDRNLATSLVVNGISTHDALDGVVLSDLLEMNFTLEDATTILQAFEASLANL